MVHAVVPRVLPTRRLLLLGLALAAARGAAAAAPAFTLRSRTLLHGVPPAQRFDAAGCGGANVSPELVWRGAPPGTRSFALTLFDRDARAGAGWWHWAVVDIPGAVSYLPLGAGTPDGTGLAPGARQLRNSFGAQAYGGPCPPPGSGMHHYVFTLWALPLRRLPLPAGADAATLAARAAASALATARLVVRYGRPGS